MSDSDMELVAVAEEFLDSDFPESMPTLKERAWSSLAHGLVRDLAEALRLNLKKENAKPDVLPPCMEPDGGECCPQYHRLDKDLREFREAAADEILKEQKRADAADGIIECVVGALNAGFMTAVGSNPDPHVKIQFERLDQMQAAHMSLIDLITSKPYTGPRPDLERIGGLSRELIAGHRLREAVAAYLKHLCISVNVGPLTNNPTKEAALLRRMQELVYAPTALSPAERDAP